MLQHNVLEVLDILSVFRVRRTTKMAVNFDPEEYSINTKFVLRKCDKNSLDIRKTVRIVKKKKFLQYTQGRNFQFAPGSVYYDHKSAYTLPWGKALNHFNKALQITSASNAFYISKKKYNLTLIGDEEQEDGIEPKYDLRSLEMVDVGRYFYNPGYVKFNTLETHRGIGRLLSTGSITCTQWDFAIYLITGELITLEDRQKIGWKSFN